jgi:hypothetical protein
VHYRISSTFFTAERSPALIRMKKMPAGAVLEHVFSTAGRHILVVDGMASSCGDFSLVGSLRRRTRR